MNVSGFIFSISGPSGGSSGGSGGRGGDPSCVRERGGELLQLVTQRKTATFLSFCKHTQRGGRLHSPNFSTKMCNKTAWVGLFFIQTKNWRARGGGDPKRGTAKKAQN
jgi:hypothetical protein